MMAAKKAPPPVTVESTVVIPATFTRTRVMFTSGRVVDVVSHGFNSKERAWILEHLKEEKITGTAYLGDEATVTP